MIDEIQADWSAALAKTIDAPMFRHLVDYEPSRTFATAPPIVPTCVSQQLPFAQPEWLPDVIARYNLTPPPS